MNKYTELTTPTAEKPGSLARFDAMLNTLLTNNTVDNHELITYLQTNLIRYSNDHLCPKELSSAIRNLVAISPTHQNILPYNKSIIHAHKTIFAHKNTIWQNPRIFDKNYPDFKKHADSLPWVSRPLIIALGATLMLTGLAVATPAVVLATQCLYLGLTSTASFSGLAYVMSLSYIGIAALFAAIGYSGYCVTKLDSALDHKIAARNFANKSYQLNSSTFHQSSEKLNEILMPTDRRGAPTISEQTFRVYSRQSDAPIRKRGGEVRRR